MQDRMIPDQMVLKTKHAVQDPAKTTARQLRGARDDLLFQSSGLCRTRRHIDHGLWSPLTELEPNKRKQTLPEEIFISNFVFYHFARNNRV
jgi:hypothetical protein